ncbi:hypothetical protein JG687_00014557 [Phytophthora cactorum]|uniref:Uncharacterized protein n=1 Tax=Phytophthora cactorum TaxID=29920 RepID=A0A8T1TYD6_9STRA|nr:hypothetical protein JG687_00014557 [Phytophthora cactorum]
MTADPTWLDERTILVTSNFDRVVLTGCTARLYAKRNNKHLFRWRRQIKKLLSPELESLVYDEDANPELFASGARGHILGNNSGNVRWGVANGTPCRLHSLVWQDEAKTAIVMVVIKTARSNNADIIDLPFLPDYINVQLLDSAGDVRIGDMWPPENNLEAAMVIPSLGSSRAKSAL